jgi:hypothetical protein
MTWRISSKKVSSKARVFHRHVAQARDEAAHLVMLGRALAQDLGVRHRPQGRIEDSSSSRVWISMARQTLSTSPV